MNKTICPICGAAVAFEMVQVTHPMRFGFSCEPCGTFVMIRASSVGEAERRWSPVANFEIDPPDLDAGKSDGGGR
jgi:hypothetical protein